MDKDKVEFIKDPILKETQMKLLSAQFAKAMMTAFEFGYEYGKKDKELK
jgi:hypothetical protein